MKNFDSVILIDDDKITNALNKTLLEKIYTINTIHVCETGFEGIVLVRRLSVENQDDRHLIFLDINMRGMNGFEFLLEFKNILAQHKDRFHIVVLSNSESIRDRVTIESLGLNFVNKPLTEDKLVSLFSIPA
jgi:two-component SAPR family response regulator